MSTRKHLMHTRECSMWHVPCLGGATFRATVQQIFILLPAAYETQFNLVHGVITLASDTLSKL